MNKHDYKRRREEIEATFGHKCEGGGATIKNSPIIVDKSTNYTINISVDSNEDRNILFETFRKMFGIRDVQSLELTGSSETVQKPTINS